MNIHFNTWRMRSPTRCGIAICVVALPLVVACLHKLDSGMKEDHSASTQLHQVTPTVKPEDALATHYRLEIERAASRREAAKERCFGMVGSAKIKCLSDGDELYSSLVRLADERYAAMQIATAEPR